MENKIKRPLSIWIAQILLVVFVLVFILAFLIGTVMALRSGFPVLGILIMTIIYLGCIALFIAAFWGMATRKSYGRWLGVVMLSLMLLFAILGQFMRTSSGPIEYYEYSNSTELMAATITQVLFCVLLLALILRIALAKKVTAFFSQTPDSRPTLDQPPPPPSFDT